MVRIYKDPVDVLYTGFDGSSWLENGEVFVSNVATGDAGITVEESGVILDGSAVIAKISGGELYEQYGVEYVMTTDGGRVKKKTIIVQIRNE